MDASFEEVVRLAEQLDPAQQDLLIYRLRVTQMQTRRFPDAEIVQPSLEREELLKKAERLRSTPVLPENTLLGKYANPHIPELSEEAFHSQMHAIASEWEEELNDLDEI